MSSTTAARANSEPSDVKLMAKYGWTREQLLAHLEVVKLLEAGVKTKNEMEALIDALLACDDSYSMRFVNNNPTNRGGIDMNSDPSRTFVEGLSNAQDAILELAVQLFLRLNNGKAPGTIDDALALIKMDIKTLREMSSKEVQDWVKDNEIAIGFADSEIKQRPTLIIKDRGIGISPSQFTCITMLRQGEKTDKGYTIGLHGQGLRTMLPFCSGIVVKSRRHKLLLNGEDDDIGVTVLFPYRIQPDRPTSYVYVGTKEGGGVSVPKELFTSEQKHGTEMRFIQYEASKFYNYQTAGTNSLYATIETALANSVMPMKMFYEGKNLQNRFLSGLAHRLGRQARKKGDEKKVAFHDSMTLQFNGGHLTVETFVVNAKDCSAYVRSDSQVLFTLSGQTHGTLRRQWLKKQANLPFIFKKLIVVARLDGLGIETLEEILPTTRENLKSTSCSEDLKDLIANAISNNADLKALDADARNQITGSSSKEVKDKVIAKVRDRISSFISKQEYVDVQERILVKPTNGGTRGPRQQDDDDSSFGEEPTYVRFAKSELNTSPGKNPWVMVEADTKNDFFCRNMHRISITTSANHGTTNDSTVPEINQMNALRGGKAWWNINIPDDCLLGEYTVTAELESVDSSASLIAEITVNVLPAKKGQVKIVTKRKLVTVEAPDLDIQWISADDMEEKSDNSSKKDPGCVKVGDGYTTIYLNEETDEVKSYLGKVGTRSSMSQQMKDSRQRRYEIAFSFGLFRQHFNDVNSESGFSEDRLQQERVNLSQSIMEAVDENFELEVGFFNDDD